MNFWDLCVAFGRAIGRGCAAVGRWIAEMLRLTYRMWWIVLPIAVLAIAAAFYYTRPDNLKYNVRAVAVLNGPSIAQFNQRYAVLQAGQTIPADAPIASLVAGRKMGDFKSFRVIDVHHDLTADYIDLKGKSSPKDTTNVQMQDRLCLQFTIKKRDIGLLNQMEKDVLDFLNADESMQLAYKAYLPNLQREVQFNHDQLEKLDSLTSQYYFHSTPGATLTTVQDGVIMAGDHRVHLFLNDIYEQQLRTELVDSRAQLATAPVAIENHFALAQAPLNPRMRFLVLFAVLGWIAGCLCGALIEQRKRLIAWLKQ